MPQIVVKPNARDNAVKVAEHLHRTLTQRDMNFGTRIFTNPCWNIALTLFIADTIALGVGPEALAAANALEIDEAMRALRQMENLGLIEMTTGPENTIASVRLSDPARRKMEYFLLDTGLYQN